jgi:uncharacterized protein YegL
VEPQGKVLLIYFVADESGSMGNNIDELNDGLISLQDSLQRESFAAAKVRLSVIGFSNDAFTYLDAADLRLTPSMPVLSAQGLTSYRSAFDELYLRISIDVPQLKAQGFSVLRPAVFFLTDGLPNEREDWRAAQHRLMSHPTAPNVLAFGIGDADPSVVSEFALVAAHGRDTAAAVSDFIISLTQSVISSGRNVAAGTAELQFERPAGFSLAVDMI